MHREAATTLAADDHLAPLVEEHGPLSLDPAEDIFERLVVSLIRQQVSMDAAAAIRERLLSEFEVTPETMLTADPERLREVGLSEAKVEYVKAAANAFSEEGYDRAFFESYSTKDVIEELETIHGIGIWTAKMFCLFCLGRPDVFPVEDLGVRKGIHATIDPELTRSEMYSRAEQWRPYRSYAALYLWRAYEK